MSIYNKKYQEFLKKAEELHEDIELRPSKYGKIKLDYDIEKVIASNKESFRKVNTVQSHNFNFGLHDSFEYFNTQKKKLM